MKNYKNIKNSYDHSGTSKKKVIFYERYNTNCKEMAELLVDEATNSNKSQEVVAKYATKEKGTTALKNGDTCVFLGNEDPNDLFKRHEIPTLNSSAVVSILEARQQQSKDKIHYVKNLRIRGDIKRFKKICHILNIKYSQFFKNIL